MPTLLQTTIAGSLPKPAWLASPGQLWAPWLLEGERLAEGKRDAVRLALSDQERAGIDIVTDGEQTRRHFVTTLIESLEGIDFEHKKTVRIRSRYDADVPVVVGPVARRQPVFVEDARFLRDATERKVKYTLPGPMTMVDTLYDAHYGSREKLAFVFAEILNDEALAIQATGVDVIQFDEPAFNVYFDEVRDWGIAALERAAQGLKCRTAVHICYGYGIKANIDWKATLGSEWRQYQRALSFLGQSSLRHGVAHMRPRPARALKPSCREGRAGRSHRRGDRPGGNPTGRGRNPEGSACLRSREPSPRLHQLRHGAVVTRPRSCQTGRAGGGGSAGPERAFLVSLRVLGRFLPPRQPFDPAGDSAYSAVCVLFQVLKHDLSGYYAVAEAVLSCP